MKNHFELFGLVPAYALDAGRLDHAYREIQARIHPDRFAHAGDAERRASTQWTTQVNEAYRTLKSPMLRAKYLLELNGVDVAFETDTAMPGDFLMQQLDLREQLEQASDAETLVLIRNNLDADRRGIETELAERLDAARDFEGARLLVRKLMFLDRLGEEVDAAFESRES